MICMYQIGIDSGTVYKCRVMWDATNEVYYAGFLTDPGGMQLTGHTLNNQKKGDNM